MKFVVQILLFVIGLQVGVSRKSPCNRANTILLNRPEGSIEIKKASFKD